MRSNGWRICFVLGAVLIAAGGPQHPAGTMEQMLASPKWVPAHLLLLAAFLLLLVGLVLFSRSRPVPERTRRWVRVAIAGTVLQVIEMALHSAAVVDHDAFAAGRATPILSTHLAISVVFYPLFAAALIGFIVAGVRDHTVGSVWFAWLGVLGLVGHGASAPLVVAFHIEAARALFPLLLGFALWMLLAGLVGPPGQDAQRLRASRE
jgi:nitrate reductase NapE component